jgi:hypothetical protein
LEPETQPAAITVVKEQAVRADNTYLSLRKPPVEIIHNYSGYKRLSQSRWQGHKRVLKQRGADNLHDSSTRVDPENAMTSGSPATGILGLDT